MGLGERTRKEVRLTGDQDSRLEKARRWRGVSAQAYIHDAVVDRIEADEAEMAGRKERKKAREEKASQTSVKGLFRGQALDSTPPELPPVPVPVVVNVGTDRTAGDLIERLAKPILEASPYEREGKLRKALATIETLARDRDERRELTEKLNAAIEKAEIKSDSILDKLTGGGLDKWKRGILG